MKLNLLLLLLFLQGSAIAQTNLFIDNYYELNTDGNYNVTIGGQGFLHITGGKINLLNVNVNHGAKGLHINAGTKVNINSSLNVNGGFIFTNNSPDTKINGNMDVQNGDNLVYINTSMTVHVLQLVDKTSKIYIKGCGTVLEAKQTTSLDGSEESFILQSGASFIANGLDINKPNIITGYGFIRVNGNFNLNHNFTNSKTITLCHKGHLNQPSKVGSAKLSCDYSCNPMPVKLEYFKTERIDKDNIKVKFRFSDLDQMNKLRVLVSKKITDKKAYLVIDRSKLAINKDYSFTINISK